jgi:hypothetical protein
MLDLNKMISSDSTLELVDAFDINDRGEIAALGVPPDVVPDPESSGAHTVLLIPCDRNDAPECGDYSDLITDTTQNNPALPTTTVKRSAQSRLTSRDRIAGWREQLARRYRTSTLRTPKN